MSSIMNCPDCEAEIYQEWGQFVQIVALRLDILMEQKKRKNIWKIFALTVLDRFSHF